MSVVSEQVDQKTYCYLHPTVETALRCNKCGNYICSRCAVRTPVGYRCPQCVRQQQDVYFTAGQTDYLIAAVVAFVISAPVIFILEQLLFFAIIFGLPVGGLISEAVHRATGRRRGRYTWAVVAAAIVLGGLAANYRVIGLIIGGHPEAVSLLLYPAIATALCAGAAAARFRFGK